MQYRQPRHRSGIWPTIPVAGSTSTAFCGQTDMQGVSFPHCWHMIGTNTECVSGNDFPSSASYTRIQVMPVRSVTFSVPGGILFSTEQATVQLPQPVHRSRSITMPYRAWAVVTVLMSGPSYERCHTSHRRLRQSIPEDIGTGKFGFLARYIRVGTDGQLCHARHKGGGKADRSEERRV